MCGSMAAIASPVAAPISPRVPATVISTSIVSPTVISAVVPAPPIRPVSVPISVSVGTVIRSGTIIAAVITGTVKDRDRNGQSEGKVNTGAGGRFSDERQSRDNHQQNNKLLHNKIFRRERIEFDQIDCRTGEPRFGLLQKKKYSAKSGDDNKEDQREHLGPVYGSKLNWASRIHRNVRN
jgi:hypothetical protein